MEYYYSTVDEIVLTHSKAVEDGFMEKVLCYFERANESGFDFAEYILPGYILQKSYGFSENELMNLRNYLKNNSVLIWDFAKNGGGVECLKH